MSQTERQKLIISLSNQRDEIERDLHTIDIEIAYLKSQLVEKEKKKEVILLEKRENKNKLDDLVIDELVERSNASG